MNQILLETHSMYSIYKITNRVNMRAYIGFTTKNPPEKRWMVHKNQVAFGKISHFYNAIRKYGIENFSFDILCSGEDHKAGLKIAEPLMIEIFKPEYNMTVGGDGCVGYKHTEEHKRKISIGLSGIRHSEEHKRKNSESHMGKQYSKGKKYPQHTEKWKQQHSEDMKNYHRMRKNGDLR